MGRRQFLRSMKMGGSRRVGNKVLTPINTTDDGCCRTILSREGRYSWENFLGRLEHGGWDCPMTSFLEVYDEEDGAEGW